MEESVVVFWTEKAKFDLKEIFDFFLTEVSEKVANSIINSILTKTKQIEINPLSGSIEPYLTNLKKQYRRIIEGNYKIVYRIDGSRVYIIRVFDARQSPNKMKVK